MDIAKYHPRRIEREITSREQLLAVVRHCRYMTMAMCRGDEPYQVALNYGFDEATNSFYVHCAKQGRKLEFLRANPRVWGMIIDDRGYVKGKCSHHYRAVMVEGHAEFVEDGAQKRRALEIMIDQAERTDAADMKAGLAGKTTGLVILRLVATAMSGKASPPLAPPAAGAV